LAIIVCCFGGTWGGSSEKGELLFLLLVDVAPAFTDDDVGGDNSPAPSLAYSTLSFRTPNGVSMPLKSFFKNPLVPSFPPPSTELVA